jgi:hypothetical protein
MAYAFSAANSRYLSTSSAPASGDPMTIAAWVRPSGSGTRTIAAVGVSSGIARNQLFLNSTNNVNVTSANAANNVSGPSVAGVISANTWGHAAGVFASTSSRTAYADGVAATPNDNGVTVGTAANTITVGVRWAGVVGNYFSGDIAEVGVWNVALTADEIASLADGFTCDRVRPQSLVFYAPLIRDLADLAGGRAITNNNTATVANHPRVYA